MADMSSVSIRAAGEADLPQLSLLSTELRHEQNPLESMDADESMSRISRYLNASGRAFLFAVEGRIIGYSLVSRQANPLNIQEFFIIPSERGQSLGNRAVVLLQEATNWTAVDVDPPVWRAMAGGM